MQLNLKTNADLTPKQIEDVLEAWQEFVDREILANNIRITVMQSSLSLAEEDALEEYHLAKSHLEK